MSCQKFSRQYLHIVLSARKGLYSLNHMDVSRLFYPSKEEAKAAQAKEKENGSNMLGEIGSTGRLPGSSIHYEPLSSDVFYNGSWRDAFALFGKSSILCSDSDGNASLYNTEAHCFHGLPRMISPKGSNRITVCIPRTEAHARSDFVVHPDQDSEVFAYERRHGHHINSLYIMDMDPCNQCNFEMLAYYRVHRWRWRKLPLPAFFGDPKYRAFDNVPFAVVDGHKICMSSNSATYYFDTVAREWSKAGDWVLPFRAKAEYIPEFGLWLGFSARTPYGLCSVNLSGVTMGFCDTQPQAQDVGQDVDLPVDCSLKNAALVNLGSGRFCIATFLDRIHDQDNKAQVVVLTGVELELDDHESEGVLSITKHKSECLASDSIVCVL